MNEKVDAYIAKAEKWTDELKALREVFISTGMDETVKWGGPVYTVNGKNVAGMTAFKNHYGIWFFNGVFLKDPYKLLTNAQEKTKAMRQIKFQKGDSVNLDQIREYVLEAIENERNGVKLKPSRDTSFDVPDQLKQVLDEEANLLDAYNALTKGKQKEYANYITEAKQEKTKWSRIDKIRPMILEGKGLHDKYRDC
ncbi:MAG: DUF1801 domain-containing protein [Bacteroidia bacterium]|nr:DUF1801 domain-containing protein [Bacteroidia bacterium]